MKNYYEILEVSENASDEIIDRAYRVLAKKYHPDTWPSNKSYWAENKFKEITEAYQVLSNPELRKKYDIEISLNNYIDDQPDYLDSQKERFNNISTEPTQVNDVNRFVKPSAIGFRRYANYMQNLLENEKQKAPDERSRDLKALILTIIIIAFLLFIFWKVPFLRNFLFP